MSYERLTRRSFLNLAALTLFVRPTSASNLEASAFSTAPERSISFLNLHTSERVTRVYWVQGQYVEESLTEINRVLRDHRTDEVCSIAPQLLDLLCDLRMRLDSREPYELISGYRSPKTNSMLRSQGQGVAENSLHTRGMAADIRVPDRSLPLLRETALAMKAGGVGYYPVSQFVHVDVGRVRSW